jgi:Ca2+-binding RTX toxin-like protein
MATFTGTLGNDKLAGTTGADTMVGLLGDDTYTVNNCDDVVTEAAEPGIDKVNSSITYALTDNVENLPSRPGEFHPEPLTDPDLILSHHPARATARRLPPSVACWVPPVAG